MSPLGRFLRRTSLDELPQLINVFRGDVSLVGPRPITRFEFERYGQASGTDWRPRRAIGTSAFRPGLTGYWQINGRSSTEYADRVRLDIAYLTNWSLGLGSHDPGENGESARQRKGLVLTRARQLTDPRPVL